MPALDNPFTGVSLNGQNGHSRLAPYTGIVDGQGKPLSSLERERQATYGPYAVPPVVMFSAMLGHAWRTFWQGRHDEALKAGREEALAMKRDAFLMGLLQERKLGSASLKWRIKVDNERDPWQKSVQEGLTKIVTSTQRFNAKRYYLGEAIWYGRYGSQMVWEFAGMNLPVPGNPDQTAKQRALKVKFHSPINGDKIDFLWDGTPYISVHGAETATKGGALPGFDTVPTFQQGRGAILDTPNKRQRFVIHKHESLDADFFDYQAASSVHGVGIRSTLFWLNWLRQEWLANISDFVERAGLGVRLWYYQGGNAKSKTEVLEAAQNYAADKTNILVPKFGDQAVEGMDVVNTIGTGAELLKTLMEHVEGHLERYVIGQTLSSDTEGSGLGGTGVASMHAATKEKIIAFDALNFDDTYSMDVVDVIKQWTYPWADFPAYFKSDLDDHDPEQTINAIKSARELGVDFIEDEVRGLIPGVTDPQPGDRTLNQAAQEQQQQQMEADMAMQAQQLGIQGEQAMQLQQGQQQHELVKGSLDKQHEATQGQVTRDHTAEQAELSRQHEAKMSQKKEKKRYSREETLNELEKEVERFMTSEPSKPKRRVIDRRIKHNKRGQAVRVRDVIEE